MILFFCSRTPAHEFSFGNKKSKTSIGESVIFYFHDTLDGTFKLRDAVWLERRTFLLSNGYPRSRYGDIVYIRIYLF